MQALEERLRQSKLDSHKLQDTLHARRRTQHYSTNISTPKELEREQKYILEAKLGRDLFSSYNYPVKNNRSVLWKNIARRSISSQNMRK